MSLPVSLPVLAVAYGVVFCGAVLQGSIGFGLGTLAVPFLLLVDPVFVPGPLLGLAFVLTILVYTRERGAVRRRDLTWGITGRLIGTVGGASVLAVLPEEVVPPLIGGLVLLALALLTGGRRLPITTATLVGAGTLSGFMGTTASIGGPPMALLYYGETGPRLRGTLSGIFIAGTLMALVALRVVGRFGLAEITLVASLLPALLLGYVVSRHSARYLDRGGIRPAILIVSAAAAVLAIVRHVT